MCKLFGFSPNPYEGSPARIFILHGTHMPPEACGCLSLRHRVNKRQRYNETQEAWLQILWEPECNNRWPSILQTYIRKWTPLLLPFYRKTKWASERWNDVPKDRELVRGRCRFESRLVWLQSIFYSHPIAGHLNLVQEETLWPQQGRTNIMGHPRMFQRL